MKNKKLKIFSSLSLALPVKRKKVLVIVAHPDDEILWMGGTLLRNKKNWDTTIVSLCRASDEDREPKFRKVCEILGVKGIIFDLDDENRIPLKQEDIIKQLVKFKGNYDYVFTHAKNGEYGHVRHKDVHRAVIKILNNKTLVAKRIFFFAYKKKTNQHQGYATYDSSADILIKLNRDEFSTKRELAIKVYGYDRGGIGFEENSAGPIEAFNEKKK